MRTSALIKTSCSIIAFAIGTLLISEYSAPAYSNATGAPAGKTGSPGDASNCTECHSGASTSDPGLITSTIPALGYVPGATYTITGTIVSDGINKFGFEISSQKTTGTFKGTLVITNTTETKLVGSGRYVTHTVSGTTGSGSRTWSFDWIAPTAGTGDVTFYGAFIAANGNATNTGDEVFLSNLPVHEHVMTGIDEMSPETNNWTVYPNPATDQLYFKTIYTDEQILSASILDAGGKLIKTINHGPFSSQAIDISDLQSGMYVMSIISEKGTRAQRFIKN